MELFSADEREAIKTQLIECAEKNEAVLSLVLVGSGAVGFTDALSDLDFYLVVDRKKAIPAVMWTMRELIEKQFGILFFEQMDARGLQVYLLQNYLEIDMGYAPIEEAVARRERYQVLFDKTGAVQSLMDESWQKNKNANENPKGHADTIFHYLFHAAVAIQRGQYWRCVAEMEIARNMLVEMKGYRYSLVTKRYRDVDRFPEAELAGLQKTLVTALTQEALLQNLLCLVDLVYSELESHFAGDFSVGRKHVLEYISSVIHGR